MVGEPVMVGVDGSPSSLEAVAFAAQEAALRNVRLHIVHAFVWPASLVAARAAEGAPEPVAVLRARAETVVDQARVRAEKAAPGIAVTTEVADGPAAFILMQRSHRAAVMVVGDRGLGRFDGILAGTVATQLATYGSCPIVVVRGQPEPDGPVVVGVDGSERSARALDFAAGEACRRDVLLIAVHVWRMPVPPFPGTAMPLVYDTTMLEAEEQRRLTAAATDLAARHPGLRIRQELGRGAATAVLTSWSRGAQLIVVGDRGHGGFVGLLLGSVSQHLIYHSACPVAVVRDERRPA